MEKKRVALATSLSTAWAWTCEMMSCVRSRRRAESAAPHTGLVSEAEASRWLEHDVPGRCTSALSSLLPERERRGELRMRSRELM